MTINSGDDMFGVEMVIYLYFYLFLKILSLMDKVSILSDYSLNTNNSIQTTSNSNDNTLLEDALNDKNLNELLMVNNLKFDDGI